MWILPKNYPSQFQPVTVLEDSKKDSKELSGLYESHAMWRSKPWPSKTWFARWKRVRWIQRLYGRTLKPSHWNPFEIELTGYLEAIHAPRSARPASEEVKMTLDTFGRLMNELSKQYDLFAVSSKTSTTTFPLDSSTCIAAYETWVTQLRQEYTVRKKLAHHMRENDYSSLPWTTPTALNRTRSDESLEKIGKLRKENAGQNTVPLYLAELVLRDTPKWTTPTTDTGKRKKKYPQGGTPLSLQVDQNWPTPRASANENRTTKITPSQQKGKHGKYLAKKWGTPTSRDYKDRDQTSVKNMPTNHLLGRMDHASKTPDGQHDQANSQYDWEYPRTTITDDAARLLGGYSQKYPESFSQRQVDQVAIDGFTGTVIPALGLSIDGYSFREDFLRALGNMVVPDTAETAIRDLIGKHGL